MTVCQYYLRGQCRFGDNCRNEHPANAQPAFGNSSWTRTNAGSADKGALPFTVTSIGADLNPSNDKPNWPLSSYAPAKHEPLLLAGLDESPEELRVKAFLAMKAGNINEYLQYESSRISAAEATFANARSNTQKAYEQAASQSKLAPQSTPSVFGAGGSGTTAFPSTSSAFGNTSTTTASAFGSTTTPSAFGSTSTTTPSAFGALATAGSTTSAFGKPAFGQPAFGQPAFGQPAFGQTSTPASTSTTTTSAFGQPQNTSAPVSAFAQPQQGATTSAFGQPSQPTTTTSAFGQPATTSAFGQPSAFGQAAQGASSIIKPASGAFSAFSGSGPSAFGGGGSAPASTNTTAGGSGSGGGGAFSAFAGQPSAFGLGAAGNTASTQTGGSVFGQPAFGQPVQPAAGSSTSTTSAFGTPAQGQTTSAFGTPSQGTTTSVFGAPSAFGAQAPAKSVFGAPAPASTTTTTPSAFGTPSTTAPTSVFGQSAFSNLQSTPSAFGAVSTAQTTTSAFGAPASQTSPFGSQAAKPISAFASTTSMNTPKPPPAATSTTLDFSVIKASYKPGSTPYDALLPPDAEYVSLLPAEVQEAFKSDKFEWGKVPEWAPPLSVR